MLGPDSLYVKPRKGKKNKATKPGVKASDRPDSESIDAGNRIDGEPT